MALADERLLEGDEAEHFADLCRVFSEHLLPFISEVSRRPSCRSFAAAALTVRKYAVFWVDLSRRRRQKVDSAARVVAIGSCASADNRIDWSCHVID